jgi:endonuclease/exonuclease/phosphatase (EEP) superfamily protein YafD
LLRGLIIAYGALVVALWALMFWDGDRGVLATLVLFGPRWICSLPLPFLAAAALTWERRLLWPLAATAVVIVGPIMGLRVHLPARGPARGDLRVLTCNVDENNFQPTALAALIDLEQFDVVALQEVSSATRFIWPPGWHVLAHNEFILASRFPIVERDHIGRVTKPIELAAICYSLKMPDREIHVCNLHLESPRQGLEAVLNATTGIDVSEIPRLSAVLKLRAAESEKISRWIAEFSGARIVMGDFNTPLESTIFRRDWSTFVDAFAATGRGFGFTKISQKHGWSYGARIDHVLTAAPLRCVRCWVARDIGSDHLPLAADLVFE